MEPIRVGEFAFTVSAGNPPNCVAVDKRWRPLAAALTAAGEGLEDLVARRVGMNKEGVVGFYYADPAEPEAGVPPGAVRAHYLDEAVVVDEVFFAEAAAAWLRAARAAK